MTWAITPECVTDIWEHGVQLGAKATGMGMKHQGLDQAKEPMACWILLCSKQHQSQLVLKNDEHCS